MTARAERFRRTKGRSDGHSFIALPHHLLESLEYTTLTAFEVKLLLDMFVQFNGRNNGDMSAAWAIMRRRGWNSKDTLGRALCGLLDKGFIQRTRQGGRHVCSLFAVTWLPINECKGKLDIAQTVVASGAWKNKTVTRLPGQSAPPAVAIQDRSGSAT